MACNQNAGLKERPLIFSGPMVRAILEGRKTQTRRIVKPQPTDAGLVWVKTKEGFAAWVDKNLNLEEGQMRLCPYGQPGDRLWVRETWAPIHPDELQHLDPDQKSPHWSIVYRADGKFPIGNYGKAWKPSIHMPRCASRLTLEITNIRVERVQDISEEDARAEGIEQLFNEETKRRRPECNFDSWMNYLWHGNFGQCGLGSKKSDAWQYQYSGYEKARDSYSSLWELIYGPGSWEKNPWVWVVEFKKVLS